MKRRTALFALGCMAVPGLMAPALAAEDVLSIENNTKFLEDYKRTKGVITRPSGLMFRIIQNGYGKRTSAFEYRRTNRGGQGITNIVSAGRNGPVVASFPAHSGEQLMLVTDQAKLIRMSVGDVRVTGRNTPSAINARPKVSNRPVSTISSGSP